MQHKYLHIFIVCYFVLCFCVYFKAIVGQWQYQLKPVGLQRTETCFLTENQSDVPDLADHLDDTPQGIRQQVWCCGVNLQQK